MCLLKKAHRDMSQEENDQVKYYRSRCLRSFGARQAPNHRYPVNDDFFAHGPKCRLATIA
jgi:hypothetical protein